MRKDKTQAISLRKEGKSYSQIQQILPIPKSTLSLWLKDIPLSNSAKSLLKKRSTKGIENLIARNKNQTLLAKNRAKKVKVQAIQEFKKLKSNPFFILGLSLYWAEGYKKGAYGSKWKCLDFTNSDPIMIQCMLRFFYTFLPVKKDNIKIQIIAHANIDIEKSMLFWEDITGIPEKQFIKTSLPNIKEGNKKHHPLLTHGTVHVRIYKVILFYQVIGWIEGLKADIKGTVAQGLERSAQEIYYKIDTTGLPGKQFPGDTLSNSGKSKRHKSHDNPEPSPATRRERCRD